MDAMKFLKERARQLGLNENTHIMVKVKDIDVIVQEVEKWSKEHPKKTKGDLLKGAFPNLRTLDNGVPNVCPYVLGIMSCDKIPYCDNCKSNFWNQEVEDDED